jgi:hypothetical protein
MAKQKSDPHEYVDPEDMERWKKLHPEDRFVFEHLSKFFIALALGKRPAKDDGTFEALGDFLATTLRLRRLEERPQLKFAGVWKADKQYDLGDLATCSGSLWHSNCHHNKARPGSGSTWQLCVKKGAASA